MSVDWNKPAIQHLDSDDTMHRARLSRRRLMGVTGAAALGAVSLNRGAGASGQQGTVSAASTWAQGAVSGVFQSGINYEPPPTGHFNHYVPRNINAGLYGELHASPCCFYLWADDEYVPVLAESWEFPDGEHFTVTLKPELVWDDGSPLTSQDLVATFTAAQLHNSQLFQYVDTFEAVDDLTVRFHMSTPSSIVERYVLRERIYAYSTYGQFTDRAYPLYQEGAASDSPEIQAIRTEFDEYRPTTWPASGPYRLDMDSINEVSLELVHNPQGVNAEVVRFERLKLYGGTGPVITPLVLAGELDYATNGLPVAAVRQLESQGQRILRTPTHFGPAVVLNYANPRLQVFTDKRARQALAHAVERESNAISSLAESALSVTYMTGVPDSITETWIEADALDSLNQYPYDQARATELLNAVGCTRDGDQWLDPAGEPMAYELIAPADYLDWAPSAQDWTDQLTRFGIPITLRAIASTQLPVERREGRFEFAYDSWGVGNPHPHFSLVTSLLSKVQPFAGGPYTSFELQQETEIAGTVDFQQLITEMALGLDVEQQRGQVLTAVQAFNELLPILPIWERFLNGPLPEGLRVTGWPADGDPIYENTAYADNYAVIMIANGTLGPV